MTAARRGPHGSALARRVGGRAPGREALERHVLTRAGDRARRRFAIVDGETSSERGDDELLDLLGGAGPQERAP